MSIGGGGINLKVSNDRLFNSFMKNFIIFEKKKFVQFSSTCTIKNDYFVWTNSNIYSLVRSFDLPTKLIDMVAYDFNFSQLNLFKKNQKLFTLFKNTNLSYRFYLYKTDCYLNLIPSNSTTQRSLQPIFYASFWLEREVSEFFHISFIGSFDTRNLLLDYNLTVPVLKKNIPLEFYSNIKYNSNFNFFVTDQTVEL